MDFRYLPGSEKDPIPTVNAAADFLSLPDPPPSPPPPGSVSSSSIPSSPDSPSSSSPSLPDSSPPESSSFLSSSWAKGQQVLMAFTVLLSFTISKTVDEDVDYICQLTENWLD